ncbi:hypothetical protein F4778DRAFT_88307 [Xylariomycetidae sp. FL2044]|nr:hypothetical protein F4778DRAFT_88307 [Xylariomycetidae sp. FL2044]
MSVELKDLSNDEIVAITSVLSRRPEYGIAVPSGKWLRRQQAKVQSLPKKLLRPSNPIRRFVIKLSENIDPTLIDPQAVLCETHSNLNAFLIRRIFMALAYEVTVHSDPIRSWEGTQNNPPLAAFIDRLDAIAALWTQPHLYRECYGVPPFDNHMVFVQSGCEACILAAVGASVQILADLRTIVIDRHERRSSNRNKEPRFWRFVEFWIDHLKDERAKVCRDVSGGTLEELREVRPEIKRWRSEQREANQRSRAGRQSIYKELKRTDSGHQFTNVPASSRYRRTRDGIPVATAGAGRADERRKSAMYNNPTGAQSVYRPDSECNMTVLGDEIHAGKSPYPTSVTAVEEEEQDDEIDPYDDAEDVEYGADERDPAEEERGRKKVMNWYASQLASHSRLDVSNGGGSGGGGAQSTLSLIHPAFQPNPKNGGTSPYGAPSFAPSAMPAPLKIKKDRSPSVLKSLNPSATWTEATVFTTGSGSDMYSEVPPVPPIPQHMQPGHGASSAPSSGGGGPRRKSRGSSLVSSQGPSRGSQVSHVWPASRQSSVYSFPAYSDPFMSGGAGPSASTRSSVSGASGQPAVSETQDDANFEQRYNAEHLAWPAPAQMPPRNPKPTKKYLFEDSDVDSRLTVSNKQYLKKARQMKDYESGFNPFTSETRSKVSGDYCSSFYSQDGQGDEDGMDDESIMRVPPLNIGRDAHADESNPKATTRRTSVAGNRRGSGSRASGGGGGSGARRPSMASSSAAAGRRPSRRGSAYHHHHPHSSGSGVTPAPAPATAEDERRWRESFGVRDADEEMEVDPVRPDDSASNVHWHQQGTGGRMRPRKPSAQPSQFTQLGDFMRR